MLAPDGPTARCFLGLLRAPPAPHSGQTYRADRSIESVDHGQPPGPAIIVRAKIWFRSLSVHHMVGGPMGNKKAMQRGRHTSLRSRSRTAILATVSFSSWRNFPLHAPVWNHLDSAPNPRGGRDYDWAKPTFCDRSHSACFAGAVKRRTAGSRTPPKLRGANSCTEFAMAS